MAGYVFIGALAAFGLMCVVWICCGFFLPDTRSGTAILMGPMNPDTLSAARRWIWLREMGLLNSPFVAVQESFSEEEQQWLSSQGFLLCSRVEIIHRLGIGEIEH